MSDPAAERKHTAGAGSVPAGAVLPAEMPVPRDPDSKVPDISIVIPFFNEEGSVESVLEEVKQVVEEMGSAYEILAIDDGSVDGTREALERCARVNPRLRVLGASVNQGQAAALFWGLQNAWAPIVVTMDGDGQNDPADIPALLEELSHADMVVGIRATRHDSWLRRAMSNLANAVRGTLLGDHMKDSGCALKVFRREVVAAFLPIKTLYSFMPSLALAAGFRLSERNVRHRPRKGGTSNYGLKKMLWLPLLDLAGVWWFTRRRFNLSSRRGEP